MARNLWGRGFWSQIDLWFRSKDDSPDPVVFEESYTLGEAPSSVSAPGKSSGGGGAKRDPSASIIKRIGLAVNDGGSSDSFVDPEYDFTEITNAYNTEGYIRQAVDKYIEMMFKADWGWTGKNPTAVEYVRQRFAFMAEATQIPTDQLFIEIAEDLVKYCNVIVAKARAKDASVFQGLNVQGVGQNAPVAGYFPLNLTTMQVRRDKNGVIKQWQQKDSTGGGTSKFKPDDIVHIYYKREKGRAFGTPWLIPALDDIRALRQIEENVLRLVYRNLHPLWHVKVGLETEGMGAEEGEVDLVKSEVENMDIEGGLVTTERVNVNAIASNQIIDAKEYLKYFEQRAFTVLGVSELLMGRGATANRSTGDNLSTDFKDRIKAMQKVMATFVNEFMVKEILMEGGFDPVLNPNDAVLFRFNEIDMDAQIKFENQAVFLYEHNAISEDEMRELLGRDPVDSVADARNKMHMAIVTLPTIEAQAQAKATLGMGAGGGGSTPTGKAPGAKSSTKATDNKVKPANQHGVKSSPKKTTNGLEVAYINGMFSEYKTLNNAIAALIKRHYEQGGEQYLETIGGAFKYTEERLIELTQEYFGDDVVEDVRIPIVRMTESIYQDVIHTIHQVEQFSEAHEIAQSVFDVFTDRLSAISTKAYEIHESLKEVEDSGQE
jgi:hypothetical protein